MKRDSDTDFNFKPESLFEILSDHFKLNQMVVGEVNFLRLKLLYSYYHTLK